MLVAFSGLKGAGKDTAADVLVSEYGFTRVAFADAVREMALVIDPWIPYAGEYNTLPLSELIADAGWDWAKREVPEVRRLLQVIGTEAGRMLFGENVWVELLQRRFPDLTDPDSLYVITDCRFDNEVDFVRNNGGCLIWIERPGLTSDGHASESTHISRLASIILHNRTDLDDFRQSVRVAMDHMGGELVDQLGVTENIITATKPIS
jgi:hypothetical protein